ncbi:MAG: hypothetical protein K2G56_02245, partial [Eubacterium sp.]|nr:hypothetical protein [Eubacterium sp.]
LIFALMTAFCCLSASFSAYAEENQLLPLSNVPYLEAISFTNAEIDGGFQRNKTMYTITLDDPTVSPTLSGYQVKGDPNVFVTYGYDGLNHQNAIIVTLSFENGSVIYTFNYSNVVDFTLSSNANLLGLASEYGEVQPAINDTDTEYKLYIPKDLTQLDITPITQDINAHCDPLSIEINSTQQPTLSVTVLASDGTTKKYTFKVRRIEKTMEEVKAEKNNPAFISFVDGELFYQKPIFSIICISAAAGLIVILIAAKIARRITVNVYDNDEKPFYKVND